MPKCFGPALSGVLLFATTGVSIGPDQWSAVGIRQQEVMLANAISNRDRGTLLSLTAVDFHQWLSTGSVARYQEMFLNREEWIRDIIQHDIVSYHAVPVKIGPITPQQAFVEVDERWIVHLKLGMVVERRLSSRDDWIKRKGAWKLVERVSWSVAP